MRRLFKISVIIIVIIITVFITVFFTAKYLLKKNNISYRSLNYHFPSGLTVKDLSFNKQSSIVLYIGYADIKWTWKSLIKGKPEIKHMLLDGLKINIISENSDGSNTFKIPEFSLYKTSLKNAFIEVINKEDLLQVNISELQISKAVSSDILVIDSLYLRNTDLSYLFYKVEHESTDSSGLSFTDIPAFELKYVELNNCAIVLDDSQNHHHVSSLDFRFSGLKNNELLNTKVDKLAFTYQDTLQMEVVLENGVVNKDFFTDLDNLTFNIPGAKLYLEKLSITVKDELNASLTLGNSHLAFGRIRQFYPAIAATMNPEIPDDSLFYLRGMADINSRSVSINSGNFSFSDSTRVTVNGSIDWSSGSPYINLKLSPFETTRGDLYDLLARESYNAFFKWPASIDGYINIKGSPAEIDINGELQTDQGELAVKTLIRNESEENLTYIIDLISDSISFEDIVTILPVTISYGDVHFFLKGEVSKDGKSDNLLIDIKSNKLIYKDKALNNIAFSYNSDKHADIIAASIYDEILSMDFNMVSPVSEKEESRLYGSIKNLVPGIIDERLPEGVFTTAFSGNIRGNDNYSEIYIKLTSTELINAGQKISFPESEITLMTDAESIGINVIADNKNVIKVQSGKVFPDFRLPVTEWLAAWPETQVMINLNVNEILFRSITGHTGSLDNARLTLNKDSIIWKADVYIPSIKYDSTVFGDLSVRIQSQIEELSGNISVEHIQNPGISIEATNFDMGYKNGRYTLKVENLLPDSGGKNQISFLMDDLESGYLLRLNDTVPLIINDTFWKVLNNNGLVFNDSLKIIHGDLAFGNRSTLFKAVTDGHNISFEIDSMRLDQILSLVLGEENLHAVIDAGMNMYINTGQVEWSAKIYDISWNDAEMGELELRGGLSENEFRSDLHYLHRDAEAAAKIRKADNDLKYSAELYHLNLDLLNIFPFWPGQLGLAGRISGNVRGELGSKISAKGFLITDNISMILPGINTRVRFDKDTLLFKQNELFISNFLVKDEGNNDLIVNGKLRYYPELAFDLFIESEKFQMMNNLKPGEIISGNVNVSASLKISGALNDLSVSGIFKTLPGANVKYVKQESFNLVDASQIITFAEFSEEKESFYTATNKSNTNINWNVDLEIADTQMEILLNEITQEHIRLLGRGRLTLKKGLGSQPMVYGSFLSENGSAFIIPPAIPDLNLNIEKAKISWIGLLDEPVITFRGYKTVMASPKGLSLQFSDRSNLENFKVYVILNQVSLSNLDLEFDLDGDASDTRVYIQSLPKDTRQTYAMNLLVFGKFGSEEVSGNSMAAERITHKLNEIASRNLKNTDLSFTANSYQDSPAEGIKQTRTDFNYSVARAFLDNRLTFSIGGSLGIHTEDISEPPPSHLIGNIEVYYRIKDKPVVNIKGSRKDVYHGIIDGDVTETSVGFSIQKSFHRLRDYFKPKRKN